MAAGWVNDFLDSFHHFGGTSEHEEMLFWERNLQTGNGTGNVDGLWYQYATMPFISGIIGFVTNVIALEMTFYPIKFWPWKVYQFEDSPIGFFGWQGIVPAKAGKMAQKSVRIMTEKLFDVQEVFRRIKPEVAAEHLKEGFEGSMNRIIDELSDRFIISNQTEWVRTKDFIKSQLEGYAIEQLPAFAAGFMEDLVSDLDNYYDLEYMCVTELTENPQLLNDVFLSVGAKELAFIRRSGFYFGFLFGSFQAVIWYFYKGTWVLPVFGFIVGYATNWIALKLIFKPVEPRSYCGGRFVLHGLFLKRQREASEMFASKIVGSVLHSENIWSYMLSGSPKSVNFERLLRRHADAFTDEIMGYARPLVERFLGAEEFAAMKLKVQDLTVSEIEHIIEFMHEYTDDTLDLEKEISLKMGALPSSEFEQVLHPVFEEDELKLILVGAALGVLVGFFQLFILF